MKKLLEAELISIAHRILKLKGRENIDALLKEAQLVTQKLTVLKFYEDYKYMVEKDIPQEDFDQQLIGFSTDSQVEKPLINHDDTTIQREEAIDSIEDITLDENEEDHKTASSFSIEDAIQHDETEVGFEEAAEAEVEQNEPDNIITDELLALVEDDNQNIENEVASETDAEVVQKESDFQNVVDNNQLEDVANEPPHEAEEVSNIEEHHSDEHTDSSVKDILEEVQTDDLTENLESDEKEVVQEEPVPSERKLEDLFQDFADFDFVKANDVVESISHETVEVNEAFEKTTEYSKAVDSHSGINFGISFEKKTVEIIEKKIFSVNDKLSGGVKVGLNDKIGFVKHLFDGSDEDFTRVISQLNTFKTHEEAIEFIENVVKPDYNYWENKEDYADRFLGILERSY